MEKTSKKKSLVFLDVSIDGDPVERMTFELFNDVAPNTAENFRALCTGEKGVSAKSGKPLHYKGTFFHRLIKGHAAQGGDFLRQNGNYGESIYEGNFPDESPKLKHDAPGLLSMAIADRDERGSLFCVTFKADHDLDRKCVVFGKLSDGYEVLKKIENAGNEDGTPDVTVKIINSGELSDADRKRRSKLKILKDTKEGNNSEVKRKKKQKRSSKKRKRRRKYYTSESDSSTDTDSDSDSDSSASSLSDTSSSSDEKHKKRKRSKRDKHKRGKRKEKRREKRRKRRDRKSKRKSKRGIVSDSDSSSEDDAAVGTLDVKQKILENQFPIVEEQETATVDHKKRETEDGEFPTQNGNYQSNSNGVEMDSNIRNASGHPGVVDHMRSKSRSRSLSPRRAPSKSMSISPSRNSRSPVTSPQRSSTPSPVTRRPMQVSDRSRSVSLARSISRSPIRSPSRSKNETSISRSPPVRSSRRSLSRSSGRVPPWRSPSPSPVRAPSRKNRHSYSRSPVSPRRRAKSPVSRSLSRSPSVDGSPKRVRRGRGFSDRYSYARRYKSRSPDRSPARSHRYGGRSDRDRYPSYRRSPRRYRSPPRGRTPPRYRPRRSRTRSPSVSRSPIRYRRRYSRSNSPVRSRSPIERYRPNRRRSPSRSRTRSESPLSRRDSQSPKDADKSGNSRSSSGSPPQKTGLVSYGDGSPD